MPAAEVDVSVELVRQLLAEQHPDLAGQALGCWRTGGTTWSARSARTCSRGCPGAPRPPNWWRMSSAGCPCSADNPLMAEIGKPTFREVLR